MFFDARVRIAAPWAPFHAIKQFDAIQPNNTPPVILAYLGQYMSDFADLWTSVLAFYPLFPPVQAPSKSPKKKLSYWSAKETAVSSDY
jgi:hypothetical protein